jgi:hypothetical protein
MVAAFNNVVKGIARSFKSVLHIGRSEEAA